MTTLKMTHSEFRRLVEPVMPFVQPDTAVHALSGVRIRTEPGRVIAEAVSETMFGMCVRAHPDAPAGFDIVFPHADIPVGGGFDALGLEQTAVGTVVVDWTTMGGSSIALREYDLLDPAHFPDLAKKIRKALEIPQRAMSVWLDAAQMAAFRVAAERPNNLDHAALVFHPGANRHDMVLVTCGDHFAGMASSASNIRKQPTRHRLQVKNPAPGDPIEVWTRQLSTPEGE